MNDSIYRVAIVGAGPAGLSAATRAADTGLEHVLLEAESHLSNTIHRFQKGKHVMAEPVRLPLRSALGFEAGSRESILDFWAREAARLKVNVRRNSPVRAIGKERGLFSVELAGGERVRAEAVVLAIGLQGQPNKLGIPGEELGYVDYQLDDPDEYDDKTIAVVGAGDAAIENAMALAERNRVVLVNRRDGFHRAAAGNRNAILAAIADGRVECCYNSTPRLIEERSGRARLVLGTVGEPVEILCDRIIARLGASRPRAFLESCGITFAGEDPAAPPVLSARYESSVDGLFVIGALAGAPLIKQALNQGYETIETIRGEPVQPVEDLLLLEKFAAVPGLSTVESLLDRVGRTIPLFARLDARRLREILLESRILCPAPGTIIFRRDDYLDSFHSILDGNVLIHIQRQDPLAPVCLEPGDFFGDSELTSGRRRTVTAIAGHDCILIETPRLSVLRLAASERVVAGALDAAAIERAIRWHLAPGLPSAEFRKLADGAACRRFEAGETLFQAGDSGDSVHYIRSGAVTMAREIGEREVPFRLVTAGDYVGEWEVLADFQRVATARATAATTTVEIQGQAFRRLLQIYPELRRSVHSRVADSGTALAKPEAGAVISFLMQHGVGEATDILLIDESLCIRCDNCEKACAATHGGISRLNREAGPTFASIHLPTSCRHCVHPHCMNDCPPNAIHRAQNGEVFINDTCIGCGNCVQNCPFGVIHLAVDRGGAKSGLLGRLLFGRGETQEAGAGGSGHKQAVKCDMCKDLAGGPACVSACPTGAAYRGAPEQVLPELVRRAAGH